MPEPPYCVMSACAGSAIGLSRPLDVPWERGRPGHPWCGCGEAIRYAYCSFTLASGSALSYWLAQCSRCNRVYWRDAP